MFLSGGIRGMSCLNFVRFNFLIMILDLRDYYFVDLIVYEKLCIIR